MKILDILPEYLNLIKSGEKKIEFRDKVYKGNTFSLRNTETGIISAKIEIAEIIDTIDFPEEDKEEILDQAFVTEEFREYYNCRYAYLIKGVHIVH